MRNSNAPSTATILSFISQPLKPKNKIYISTVDKNKNKPSLYNNLGVILIALIIAVPPRMKPRLKIFEPITLPIDISV